MHPTQKKILDLSKQVDIDQLTLRRVGELIGERHPQTVKYHLDQLKAKSLIGNEDSVLLSVPVMGSANAGPASFLAEDNIEHVLRISRRLVPKGVVKKIENGYVFALQVVGDSMNRAGIVGGPIVEGDYVLVDKSNQSPVNGDYIVSLIDGAANIKRFAVGQGKVVLSSESSRDYPPIIVHPDDSYFVAGKVAQVVKMPDLSEDSS